MNCPTTQFATIRSSRLDNHHKSGLEGNPWYNANNLDHLEKDPIYVEI